jgi:hypothetical protein
VANQNSYFERETSVSSGSRLKPEATAQRANLQSTPALAKLPAEIMEMIFQEILDNKG